MATRSLRLVKTARMALGKARKAAVKKRQKKRTSMVALPAVACPLDVALSGHVAYERGHRPRRCHSRRIPA
jgi:hypothetical protein